MVRAYRGRGFDLIKLWILRRTHRRLMLSERSMIRAGCCSLASQSWNEEIRASKIKDQYSSFRVAQKLQPRAGRIHAAMRAAGWSIICHETGSKIKDPRLKKRAICCLSWDRNGALWDTHTSWVHSECEMRLTGFCSTLMVQNMFHCWYKVLENVKVSAGLMEEWWMPCTKTFSTWQE